MVAKIKHISYIFCIFMGLSAILWYTVHKEGGFPYAVLLLSQIHRRQEGQSLSGRKGHFLRVMAAARRLGGDRPMTILVSACLLGCPCRYDGKSKPHESILALLGEHTLIPICPEQMGGLATPRPPAERINGGAFTENGGDVTEQYRRGAEEALHLAKLYGCTCAVLKERSPSCGSGQVYDGSFSRTLVPGDGVTAALLKANGITVLGESEVENLWKSR